LHCLQPGDDHSEDCHHGGVRAGTAGSLPSLSISRYWHPARGSWTQCLPPHPLWLVVVLGHPHYYPRFGCTPAKLHGLVWEHDVPTAVFMVQELRDGALTQTKGVVKYRPEFDVVSL